jgi:hypothetical protein
LKYVTVAMRGHGAGLPGTEPLTGEDAIAALEGALHDLRAGLAKGIILIESTGNIDFDNLGRPPLRVEKGGDDA